MASVAFHQFNQFSKDGTVKLFGTYGGYAPGAQMRDFVFIDDVVAVNLWFFDHPAQSGIFNLGTGAGAQPFNDVATSVINAMREIKGEPPLTPWSTPDRLTTLPSPMLCVANTSAIRRLIYRLCAT